MSVRKTQRNYSVSSRKPGTFGSVPTSSGNYTTATFPVGYSRTSGAYSTKARKKGKRIKVAAGVLCTLLLTLIGCGTAFAMYVNSVNESLAGGKTGEEQAAISEALVEITEYSDPFYLMLIGSDARADNDEMGQRSDTNILVRVDPKNAQVTMLSIPRDTMIELDGYGTNKFNAAYSYGGAALAISEASTLCGVDIAHYAEINFDELIALVDTVGGVEVDVPELIDDPQAGPVVLQPGPQTLNGQAALTFARSRAYADGDFTRTSNQRLLVEAIIKKVLAMPVTELSSVISQAAQCVTTDLSIDKILNIAMQFKDIKNITVYSAMVPSTTAYLNEISYVVCITDALTDMMKLIETGKDPNTLDLSAYSVPSYNGSGSGNTDTYNTYTYTDDTYYYDPGYTQTPPETYEPAPTPTPDPGVVDPGTGDGGGSTGTPPAEAA